MDQVKEMAVAILCRTRCSRGGSVTLSEISEKIFDCDICNWPKDGSIPAHSGGIWFEEALVGLIRLNFIEVERPAIRNGQGKAPGYFGMDAETTKRVLVALKAEFELLQSVLGFSLTEHATRTENSVIASPKFSLKRPTAFDVFVLMPFSDELRIAYDSAIQPVCESRSLKCGRGDDFFGSDYIIDEIWTAIFNTDHLIADCTGQNPNVFYELGIAHLLGKEVLIVTQNESDIPFDLRHRRYTLYDTTPEGISTLKHSIAGYLDAKV